MLVLRDADPDFGIQQAKNLQLHLEVVVEHRPVRVVMSSLKKSVVVQPAEYHPDERCGAPFRPSMRMT